LLPQALIDLEPERFGPLRFLLGPLGPGAPHRLGMAGLTPGRQSIVPSRIPGELTKSLQLPALSAFPHVFHFLLAENWRGVSKPSL
jgi:hypothetical protein